jgi:hypothetical protein
MIKITGRKTVIPAKNMTAKLRVPATIHLFSRVGVFATFYTLAIPNPL